MLRTQQLNRSGDEVRLIVAEARGDQEEKKIVNVAAQQRTKTRNFLS